MREREREEKNEKRRNEKTVIQDALFDFDLHETSFINLSPSQHRDPPVLTSNKNRVPSDPAT
jgi:hypothetical protein